MCIREGCYNPTQAKYCSRSCAAKVNNARRVRITKVCKNCPSYVKREINDYCSNRCFQDFMRKDRVRMWLETGQAIISSDQGHYIREHIFQEQNHRCALCPQDAEWNGKALIFVLDHVNGNAEDNRRENLRLVCPNCDSQLPTYKSKNKGNGRSWRRDRYRQGQSY